MGEIAKMRLGKNIEIVSLTPLPLIQFGSLRAARQIDLGNPDQPRDDHGRWTSGGGVGTSERATRARNTYKPATRDKHQVADRMEKIIQRKIGGTRTADNEAFDVIKGKHAIEVKTVIDATNDKITMHPSSRQRKLDWAKTNKSSAHTVVIDKRGSRPVYYYKAGVGSYRFGSSGNMTKVSTSELKGLFR